MDDASINNLLLQAYLLGQQILYKTGQMPEIKAGDDKSWDILCAIAEGKTTIASVPEEMLANIPIAPHRVEEVKGFLTKTRPKVIEKHREVASRIIEAMNTAPKAPM